MGQPASVVLEEFDSDETTRPPNTLEFRLKRIEQQKRPDVVAARLQEAYARGYAEGEAYERRVADQRIAELTVDSERRMEAMRRELAVNLIERLVAACDAGVAQARHLLASQISDILLPVLKQSITERAIFELADRLAGIMEADGAVMVHIRGPESLVDLVLEALSARALAGNSLASRMRSSVADTAEVSVEVGEAVIETRLWDWLRRLEEARRR